MVNDMSDITINNNPGAELAAMRHKEVRHCDIHNIDYVAYTHTKGCPKCLQHERYLRHKLKKLNGGTNEPARD